MLFGAGLAADAEAVAAARGTQLADPAAGALLGIEREVRAAGEVRGGRAERSADQLAPAAFELDPEPTRILVIAAEVEARRDRFGQRQLVALAARDDQVEGVAAAETTVPLQSPRARRSTFSPAAAVPVKTRLPSKATCAQEPRVQP